MQYALPDFNIPRTEITPINYPKVFSALATVDDVIEKQNAKVNKDTSIVNPLNHEEVMFYKAYNFHWVHTEERKILTTFICKLISEALK